jgi:large subunit ribosomal protein L31
MKIDIHPTWYPNAKVTCACGASFVMGAAVPEFKVEICSACHPFYTGQMKYIDTAGRVEAFKTKQSQANTKKVSKKIKRELKKQKELQEELARPDSLEALRKKA